MLPQSKNWKDIFLVLCVLSIVTLFFLLMMKREGAGKLSIKFGTGEITMDLAENSANFIDLLEKLLGNAQYSTHVLSVLRDHYGLYKRDCRQLIDSFRQEAGDTELAKNLRELLYDLKGPFAREYHDLYDITKPEVVDCINRLGYDHKVAVKLRELRDNAKGIFETRGIKVEVSFFPPDELSDGNAAVCEGSKYRGRDLLLLDACGHQRSITVFSRTAFPCIKIDEGAIEGKPLIRINLNDGRKLFENVERVQVRLGAKGEAILIPAPSGYSIRPFIITGSKPPGSS